MELLPTPISPNALRLSITLLLDAAPAQAEAGFREERTASVVTQIARRQEVTALRRAI